MSECYVLCEGYHYRAFWAGVLLNAGCVDPGNTPGGRRITVYDAYGDPIRAPVHGFRSKSGRCIRVVPAGGKDKIGRLMRNRLNDGVVKPLSHLVVSFDSDLNIDGSPTVGSPLSIQGLTDMARHFDPKLTTSPEGDLQVSAGQTTISIIPWQTTDAASAGIPLQQTLERIICAALIAVYPNRAAPVQSWLDARPDAPLAGPREYAWSYLAGWHAAVGGYEGFCSMIWQDRAIAEQLRHRLEESGVWRIAELLAL